ncbi:MAG: 50S ribosomal protein L18 [Pirellulaceae bacterium]|nr:MAG: 50S ribosomal protein L18 [Pirellulaceae bacterium]GIW94656.1 MAG: 50S ribosomal protein L18 [Pirellulaceae bacterium]
MTFIKSELKKINARRRRRRLSVRNRLRNNLDRPRLSVFRSNRHISAQVIDDRAGRTLASASTLDRSLRDQIAKPYNKEAAAIIGRVIAERALAAGVREVRFDRGHYKYHGRVAALAEAARQAGLVF